MQILADANANGTGYSPTCGGVKGILVNVTGSPTRQLTMVEVPVRCCGSTNFGNQQAIGNISGYKLLQPGNTGLGCWTINLYYGNGTLFQSNITNDTGYFRFNPVPGGNYILNETLQSGWSGYFLPGEVMQSRSTSPTRVS